MSRVGSASSARGASDAEVEHLRPAVAGDEDVAGFEVAVENAAAVGMLAGVANGGEGLEHLGHGAARRVGPVVETLAGDVLHHQEAQTEVGAVGAVDFFRAGLVEAGDARVVEAGEKPGLCGEAGYWNALGLGATAAFPAVLVYNTRRSGEFTLGRRCYRLRRVRFSRRPSLEWYVIDLLEHHEMAGMSRQRLANALAEALRQGRFDPMGLRRMAREYATQKTRDLIESAIDAAR